MRIVLVVLIGMIAASAAWGAVYEWVDSKGVVNMTDDPEKVPAAYRKSMKSRDIDTRDQIRPVTGTQTQPVDIVVGPAAQSRNYDGHDEQWWRSSFKSARTNIIGLQVQIETDKKSLEELHRQRVLYQRPSDRVAYFQLADHITREEEQLKDLQAILANLEFRAGVAGVPMEWRQ
jgi:Domain of unknown function (DUF4124)